MARPKRDAAADAGTRERLVKAASAEFAARGFAGAKIDRIAAAAGLNKAMIYYHFKNKADLYREILRDMFQAVGVRVQAVVASDATPDDKVRRFVSAIATEAQARPHFPPIWFREIAEEGSHLDAETIRTMGGIIAMLGHIVDEGVRARRFRRINPLIVHAGIVAPLLLFFASTGLRQRLQKAGLPAAAVTHHAVIEHIQNVALATLQGKLS